MKLAQLKSIVKHGEFEWEKLTDNKCTINDLDKKRIKEVVRMGVYEKRLPAQALKSSIPDILKKFNLIIGNKLTNAAVILFCKNENKQFMQSHVKLARFRGLTKSAFINNKMYTGNIFDLYEKADDYLFFYLPVEARIVPRIKERVETPAIPYSVLREALVNALVHRDYSHPGGSIDVAIFDDRVEITNTGFLPQGVDINQLWQSHKSVPRNPLIAHVFYICGKIEKWGRGTLDMIEDCKAAGNPLPVFAEIGGGFSVTLPLKEPVITIIYKEDPALKNGLNGNIPTLTDRQKKIMHTLQNCPLNRQQIMKKTKMSVTDRVMQLELSKLKKQNLIASQGKAQATVWALKNKK